MCREIRGNNNAFGNIQVITCGDFYQLKPVPNYNDPGDYCFESKVWKSAMSHVVVLDQVMRQQDQELVNAINELSSGVVSDNTNTFLANLSRPLPDASKSNSLQIIIYIAMEQILLSMQI